MVVVMVLYIRRKGRLDICESERRWGWAVDRLRSTAARGADAPLCLGRCLAGPTWNRLFVVVTSGWSMYGVPNMLV